MKKFKFINRPLQEIFNSDPVLQFGNVLFKRYINNIKSTGCNVVEKETSLTLANLQYCFVLLIVGLVLSFLVYVADLLFIKFLHLVTFLHTNDEKFTL